MIILAIVGLANALRVLWLKPTTPTNDAVWDACLCIPPRT